MSWNTYYTGDQKSIQAALDQVNTNCTFPNSQAQTWSDITQSYDQTFWFFIMPPPTGMIFQNGTVLTQAQMILNVTGVTQEQSQSNWWPPPPGSVKSATEPESPVDFDIVVDDSKDEKTAPMITPETKKSEDQKSWTNYFGF